MLIVLVSIAVLAFGAASVAAAQVVQRNRERWLVDSERLRTLGMAREQIVRSSCRPGACAAVVSDRRHDVACAADRDWPRTLLDPAGLRST
jgi:hypothetical protein